MDDLSRFLDSSLVTAAAAAIILGVAYLVKDYNSKEYCVCGHEYNEHWVTPRGMINPLGGDQCKLCKCKNYNKNPVDKRNT